MNSAKPKILHEVGGMPMVDHLFEAASAITSLPPVLVVAPDDSSLSDRFGSRAQYVVQPRQLGTGHAVLMAADLLRDQSDQVLVAYADMPLLRAQTMARLADKQRQSGAAIVLLTVRGDPASTFGRILRDKQGHVTEIVEVAEARRRPDAASILSITELNAGVYCFDASWLWSHLPELPLRQARSGEEYYLTDMVAIAVAQGSHVESIEVSDPDEFLGAGTREELAAVEKAFRRRAVRRWMERGVSFIDPATSYIDQHAVIGRDTVIWPNTFILGSTSIGTECLIGPNTILRDTSIGDRCRVEFAVLEGCHIEDGATVEPFTHRVGDNDG